MEDRKNIIPLPDNKVSIRYYNVSSTSRQRKKINNKFVNFNHLTREDYRDLLDMISFCKRTYEEEEEELIAHVNVVVEVVDKWLDWQSVALDIRVKFNLIVQAYNDEVTRGENITLPAVPPEAVPPVALPLEALPLVDLPVAIN